MSRTTFDVIVIGGGLHGLATAWHLASQQVSGRATSVAVVDQFRLGHARGSSHGSTRITRSTYGDPAYVELMRVARAEDWRRLESDAHAPLVRPCEGIFFGPRGGVFDAFAAQAYGDEVELVSREVARARFPLFSFVDAPEVLLDHTAGVIEARATLDVLARVAILRGVTMFEDTRVFGIDHSHDPIVLDTSNGAMRARRLVVTAGPWTTRLVPELATRLRTVRQHVGYFHLDAPEAQERLGAFPVFAHLGATTDDIHYGLPSWEGEGIKAARHTMRGNDDPELLEAPSTAALESVERFLAEQITVPVRKRVSADTCFFTVTEREDYILDVHPRDPRIVIGAGFSGHGFKLGPTSGRILAELVLHGRSTVEPFERHRAQFAIG